MVFLYKNSYVIFDEILQGNKSEFSVLREAYQNSDIILSISQDTSQCIRKAFDFSSEKILIVTPSINQKLFSYNRDLKENIIACMPRKLSSHANYVINQRLLKKHDNWKIVPIDGVSETEVAYHLSRSKIFLSFSDREGLSLPPLEAAFCGNSVIRYTGEGAKKYWSSSLFKEVGSGNLLEFIQLFEAEINHLKHSSDEEINVEEKMTLLENLKKRYSLEAEIVSLRNFISKI